MSTSSISPSTTNNLLAVKLHVTGVGEKLDRHTVRVATLPDELVVLSSKIDFASPPDTVSVAKLYYEPFLGSLCPVEGDAVPFLFNPNDGKLFFMPSSDLYFPDPSVPLSYTPSLVGRMYISEKRKGGPKLFWCTGITKTKKKKQKAIVLDVAQLCASYRHLDAQLPDINLKTSEALYDLISITKLTYAAPKRLASATPSPGPSRSSSSNSVNAKHLSGPRLRSKMDAFDEESWLRSDISYTGF